MQQSKPFGLYTTELRERRGCCSFEGGKGRGGSGRYSVFHFRFTPSSSFLLGSIFCSLANYPDSRRLFCYRSHAMAPKSEKEMRSNSRTLHTNYLFCEGGAKFVLRPHFMFSRIFLKRGEDENRSLFLSFFSRSSLRAPQISYCLAPSRIFKGTPPHLARKGR